MAHVSRISRSVAVAVVLLNLWLVGSLCFAVVMRLSGSYLFVSTDNMPSLLMMLGGFYLQWIASQFLPVGVAGIVIAHSSFSRSYFVLGGLVAAYYSVAVAFRWMFQRPAWESIKESALTMALSFEAMSFVVLCGMAICFLYFYRRMFSRSFTE